MRIAVKGGKKELIAVGGIWLFLFLASLIAWSLLKANANDIINHIEYVETGRFGRAEVLYEEGRKLARSLFERSGKLNEPSRTKVVISSSDSEVVKALATYHRAERLDPRPRHDPQRAIHYDFQGSIYDIVNNRLMQYVLHAEAFLARGDVDNALGYLSLAAEINSTSSEMLLVRGYAEMAAGNTSSGLTALDALYATGEISSRARMLKAELLFNSGDREGGVAELQTALHTDAENTDIYKRVALYQMAMGLKGAALKTFAAGVNHGGNTDGNYMHLYGGLLYEFGQNIEAVNALKLAAELEPHSGPIQWDLARSYNKIGKTGLAGRALQLAIKLDPGLAEKVF